MTCWRSGLGRRVGLVLLNAVAIVPLLATAACSPHSAGSGQGRSLGGPDSGSRRGMTADTTAVANRAAYIRAVQMRAAAESGYHVRRDPLGGGPLLLAENRGAGLAAGFDVDGLRLSEFDQRAASRDRREGVCL